MVTPSATSITLPWEQANFVGGHLALDLVNTVYHRSEPVADNELLRTAAEIGSWCQSAGLITPAATRTLVARADEGFADTVRRVRENAWEVFNAMVEGAAPPSKALGHLLRTAGLGASAQIVSFKDGNLDDVSGDLSDPEALPAALSLLALEALFVLPKDRIRACPRCGWLFVDTSKGGRRRWCSMSTCGNREKADRHRHA